MPIHYVCVACREEVYLPDSKAGSLQGCPRCRLKFLAPAPNVQVVPAPGAAPPAAAPRAAAPAQARPPVTSMPTPGASSRPSFGNVAAPAGRPAALPARPTPAQPPARPAAPPPGTVPAGAAPAPTPAPAARAGTPSPPPVYPRDAAKPPLYPLDSKGAARPAAQAPARPAPAKPAPNKATNSKINLGETSGVFGLHSGEVPALFGSEEEAPEEPGELFADAIPSAPDAELDDELDIPIHGGPASGAKRNGPAPAASGRALEDSDDDEESAADEGGGVAVPEESDAVATVAPGALETDRVGMPDPAFDAAASGGEIGVDPQALDANADALSSSDALISMDDLFAPKEAAKDGPRGAAKAAPTPPKATPAFGSGGVLPAPFLKPATPGASVRPFTLVAVEGIADGPFQLTGGEVYLLGRDKDAQVKILSTSVSRRHARIDATGGDHVLIDLGSANGTQVNGQSVARHPLKEGDIIRMGKVLLRYTASS